LETLKTQADAGCGLTFDFWRSVNHESFLEVTIAVIDKDYTMHSYCLGLEPFNEQDLDHDSDTIASVVKGYLDFYKIDIQLTTATTDNAANVKKACAASSIAWIPCAPHTLQLCIRSAFNACPEAEAAKINSLHCWFLA
jgi:hypothetical protein